MSTGCAVAYDTSIEQDRIDADHADYERAERFVDADLSELTDTLDNAVAWEMLTEIIAATGGMTASDEQARRVATETAFTRLREAAIKRRIQAERDDA